VFALLVGLPAGAACDPPAGARSGMGFAIQSDTAVDIANQLISTGKVTNSGRASLNITATTVTTTDGQEAGVGLVSVDSGGAAAKAGLRAGDVIVKLGDQPTPSVNVLNAVLATLKPSEQVQVTYLRAGSNTTSAVKVTLGTLTS
jgi:putative serine protease PepD